MSIEKRISKLEERTSINGFCECKTPKTEIQLQDSTSDSETTEPRLMGEPIPDICPQCGREIEKQIIIIEFVESHIPKLEQVETQRGHEI